MIVWNAFEISINLFQASLYLYFIKSRIRISKNSWILDTLAVSGYTLFLTSYLFFDIPVSDSFGCLVFFAYLFFASDEKWHVCAFWIFLNEVITIATIGIITQLYLSVFEIPYETLLGHNAIRIVFVTTTNLVLFLVVFVLSKLKSKDSPINQTALFLFSTLNIAILVVIEILFSYQFGNRYGLGGTFYLAYACLILCSILSVILFYLMTTISERDHQMRISLNQAQITKAHQQALQDMYKDMISRQHDFKHQIQVLEQLVKEGGSEKAQEYFGSIKRDNEDVERFLTGCIAVDALLTAKVLACTHSHITFELSHCPLNELPISEVDFCSIIGNLIDNAIEGIERIKEKSIKREIHLSFSRIWDMFIIRCENPVEMASVIKNRCGFITSKEEGNAVHGFGIYNIVRIVEKAEGFSSFETENGRFVAMVTIPYPVKKQ